MNRPSLTFEITKTQIALITKAKQTKSTSPKIISGKVVDEKGEPIAGATIWLKETSIGQATDNDGKYKIEVSSSVTGILVASFIGCQSLEENIGNRSVINFSLKETSKAIDDVVVIGYGSQRKESVVGAISSVTSQQLRSPVANISTTLAGQVTGLVSIQRSGEPGSSSSFWIRGISTLNNSANKPLVLVDGIERSMDLVDVEDINSFSVLKDATATAVYGVRGANGVILITTRSGAVGAPKVTVRMESGLVAPTQLPKMANAAQFIDLYNEASTYTIAHNHIIHKLKLMPILTVQTKISIPM